ncbi:DUF5787 family protein [Halobacterium bonnevillei]|uniref:DUF5787 family protein n=1 Tax=Halobacterium bonnevillei TaxID=2692200 RepID=UPI002278B6A7|nr:DUF5787 family protein [Halobacterium bonnevillei]
MEIAERAYERGWRSYLDTMRPDCRHFALQRARPTGTCRTARRRPRADSRGVLGVVPRVRTRAAGVATAGWPLSGGPGAAIRRVLDERRQRRR